MTETFEQVIAARDALLVEVEQLRAALPKWRKAVQSGRFWFLGDNLAWATKDMWCGNGRYPRAASCLSEAMRAAESALGLPICEVVND